MALLKAQIMDGATVLRTMMRIAHEITEKNKGTDDVCLVGIKRRGVPLGQILQENFKKIEGTDVPLGELNIHSYRDDLEHHDERELEKASLPFEVTGKKIILVDDVLYTGRTVRAAIEAVFSLGRPQSIQLAILIDRGHRELPIRADFVGKNIPTSHSEFIAVKLPELDGEMCVELYERD